MNWINEGNEFVARCLTMDSGCPSQTCIGKGCNFCIGTVTCKRRNAGVCIIDK